MYFLWKCIVGMCLCAKDFKIHLTLYDLQVVGLWWRAKEYEVHLTLYDLILNNFTLNHLEKNSQVSDILCNLNNKVKIKIVCFLHLTKCLNMYDMLLLIFGGHVFWGHFFYLENSNFCLYHQSFSLPNLKKKALQCTYIWKMEGRVQKINTFQGWPIWFVGQSQEKN